ncbi:MAG TPA: CoA transferase, partial [Thermodesulfobacteriota bacterium]|nr:CoA transferase [Thermodesulfobacteriota bacterium]
MREGAGQLPLAGIRILDFTRVLAGPYCTMLLGDLGADVVKVEPPGGGDETRSWGPPFVRGESAYFLAVNRNKRSLVLDLAHPEARAAVERLVASADVLVENFRPGVAERLGLSAARLTARYPQLVYCAISAFGQGSPGSERPGYDLLIQAESGLMSVTGEPDGPPVKVGVAIADLVTGLHAALAIVAAIAARPARGGRGGVIDVSLYDCTLALLSTLVTSYLATGRVPGRWGSAHPQIVPYQAFAASDGYLVVCVTNDKFWRALCTCLERPDLADDPHFATNAGRVAARERLVAELAACFARRPVAEWLARLAAAGVPAGPI